VEFIGVTGSPRLTLVERSAIIDRFLSDTGWERRHLTSLIGDASFRRYGRLNDGARRAILMDAPPPMENVRPFVLVCQHLIKIGLSAPKILAANEDEGLLLLEDFGDDTLNKLLSNGHKENSIYKMAVDLLIYLHNLPPEVSVPNNLPKYDRHKLIEEVLLFFDWYLPSSGLTINGSMRRSYIDAWEYILDLIVDEAPVLVLRDFHVDNLMQLAGKTGLSACGLLDFQDAVAGPRAYDLMSLLEDARRDVSDATKAEMLKRYLGAVQVSDEPAFHSTFTILAAQRHTKVIGIFTRLKVRDGKATYMVHIPRVWRLLKAALADPLLEPVASWFKLYVPQARCCCRKDAGAA
jgi:hypothetical protein